MKLLKADSCCPLLGVELRPTVIELLAQCAEGSRRSISETGPMSMC